MKHKTKVALKMTDFWYVIPCSLVDIKQRFWDPSATIFRTEV
jgi:hypothetical protein